VPILKKENKLSRVLSASLIVLLSAAVLVESGLAAEKFPSREIVIVVPYAAGGPQDLATRVLVEYLKKEVPAPVVVENRSESQGIKGTADVYRAKPDGYLLLNTLFPRIAQTEVAYTPPFKCLELTYLAAVSIQDILIAVHKDSPYKTLADLRDASKKKSLNCSIAGYGSRSHLIAMVLKRNVGVNLEVVPFKGGGPAAMALLGKTVDLSGIDDLTLLLHKDNLRPLATYSNNRSRLFPNAPTFKESGYGATIVPAMSGITGPPGLSAEITNTLSTALSKVIKNPDFISKLEKLGPTVAYMSGPEFRIEAEHIMKGVVEFKDVFIEEK
jgi:tripartite-type tricarboxylate transporter receptor subunit TctC